MPTPLHLNTAKLFCFVIYLSCSLAAITVTAQTFRNPIRESAADPTMAYYNGYYYLTYTNGSELDIVKAASVADLYNAPAVKVWSDNTPGRCCEMWAPSLRLLNGPNGLRWYLYYAADDGNDANHRIYVIESSSTDPMGPYTFKNKLIPNNGDEKGIDGNVLVKDDGSLYFIWCYNSRIAIATMSNPWTVTSNRVIISVPTYTWEKQMAAVNENPAAIKRNGKTFITYSASHCASPSYAVGMITNTDGNYMNAASWVKTPNPVFEKNPAAGVYGTGGMDFFTSPDGTQDWFVYHATSNSNGDCGPGRSARIQQLSWNGDGTPNFGAAVSTTTDIPVPSSVVPWTYGTYRITNVGSGKVLDASGCSGDNGVRMQQYPWWGGNCQRWLIEPLGDGWNRISSQVSGRVLDLASCSGADGATVQLYDWLNNDCQRWRIEDWGNGQLRIVNKASRKLLDVSNGSTADNTQVWQWTANGSNAQRWMINRVSTKYIQDGTYRIRLARNNRVVSLKNGVDARSTPMNLWDWLDSGYQKFNIQGTADGWYRVLSPNGYALDLASCSSADGATVQLWDWLDNDCQRWSFDGVPGSTWIISSKASGKVLDAPADVANGGVVYQWSWLNNDNQKWYVEAPPATTARVQGLTKTTAGTDQLLLSPNPVHAGTPIRITYRSSSAAQAATILLTDMAGKILQQQKVMVQKGYNLFSVPTASLRSGMYLATLFLGSTHKKESKKLILVE